MSKLSLAEKKCLQRDRPFHELFRGQYVLSQDAGRHYPGWTKTSLGNWTIHHGPALPRYSILDASGQILGHLLGLAWQPPADIIKGPVTLPFLANDPDLWTRVQRFVSDLGGRYMVLVSVGRRARLYGDPVLDLPIVYDPTEKQIASSLGLVLDRPIQKNDAQGMRSVLSGRENLCFQNTLDQQAKRLISNHYLDLNSFRMRRYWPTDDIDFDKGPEAVDASVAGLCETLAGITGALVQNYDCALPVTGGRDSRIMLGSLLPHKHLVREYLCHRFHNASRMDVALAREVLQSVDLELRQYSRINVSHQMLKDMRLKMGWSGTRRELLASAIIDTYPRDHLLLRGNIMEILRANQWRSDKLEDPFHIVHAIRRLGPSKNLGARTAARIWRQDYLRWRKSLPEGARNKLYDFGFIEFMLPNSQGPYISAYHNCNMINPFNDRRLIQVGLELPQAQRISRSVVEKVIGTYHAPFLDIPFN
ncbi:MAG: hypothetical protein N4A61_06715 [Pelagimonas sp.]|nr:hypothetical protein [Pelagimonas sp.]